MGLIIIPSQEPKKTRRAPDEVLGVVSSASPRGNTYYSRMLRCAREHALATVVRLHILGDNEALSLGFLFHAALEGFYRRIQVHQKGFDLAACAKFYTGANRADVVADAFSEAMTVIHPFSQEPGYEKMYPQLVKMLYTYRDNYQDDPWYIVAVEETLATDEPEFSARLDLVVVDLKEMRLFVVEHKTAKAFTDDLLSGYQMNMQIMGQAWLMKQRVDLTQYPPFGGIVVNIVGKQIQPQVIRVPVFPSDAHLAAFEGALRQHEITATLQRTLGYPPDFTKCSGAMRGFRKCDYYNLCYTQPTLDVRQLTEEPAPHGYERNNDSTDSPARVADVDD